MPTIAFINPEALLLLLLLPLLWAAALAGQRRLTRARWYTSLALRTFIAFALILGLSGAQLVLPRSAVTTVFLLDGSDSVALSQRARAEGYVQQALAAMPPDDRAGLAVFGAQALVERQPAPERTLGQISAQPGGSSTDLAAALRLGLALLPAEGDRRLVLLSDGGETTGDALAQARIAAAAGVPVDIVPLSSATDGYDAQISSIDLPAVTRAGQRPRLRIALESSAPASAQLSVTGPGGTLIDQPIQLEGGTQNLEILLPEPPPAFNRYVVRLSVEGDARPENNAAEAFTFASGRPRILLIEGAAGAAAQLAAALTAAGIETTTITPDAAPRQVADLVAYDATVLVDLPRRAIPDDSASAISQYVHDLGRGLMMVGGPQSFGAGGWHDTPVEAALPVTMDIPPILRTPPVSVVVVIDTSGSMAAEEGGRTKLSLAVEGAQRIASLLRDEDELTVIPFDDQPRDVVGPLPGSRREDAIRALERVQVGGGGIAIHDALVEAARTIRASTHPVRHIITITDGDDTTQQEGALEIVQGLRAEGVTLTSIAIGDGKDVAFLQGAAVAGGGRTFLTDRATNLPAILVDETQAILRPYLLEIDFTPALGLPHPALRLASGAPALHGLVLTSPKDSAEVLLAAPNGEAVLVGWQYGLGRSLAWTSDLTGRWGKDWVRWAEFPRVAAQMVAWLLPTDLSQGLSLEASTSGDSLTLDARAADLRGDPHSGLRVTARLFDSAGRASDLALREIEPGRYRVTAGGQPPGAYLIQLIASDASGAPIGVLTAGAVVPLSAEYRAHTANPALLEEIARLTGGRMAPEPAQSFAPGGAARGATQEIGLWLIWLALALLPLDIAVRRLFWRGRVATGHRTPDIEHKAQDAGPRSPPETPTAAPGPARPARGDERRAEELERLREEQERARKRARGESD